MTQPQARVVKPRSRTRLIPPSSRAWGPTPASRNSANPRDAHSTAEQTPYRREVQLRVRLPPFYQGDRPVNPLRIEPTRLAVPTIGFDLRQLGVWEARDNVITVIAVLNRIDAAIQLEENSWLAPQQPARIAEARSPEGVVGTAAIVESLTRGAWLSRRRSDPRPSRAPSGR